MTKKDKEVIKEQIEAHQKSPCSTGKCNVCEYLKGQSGKKSKGFKVSKISSNPTRKINLGNYNTVELSAFVEITFDNPVLSNSPVVKNAFNEIRRIVKDEWVEQYKPYMPKKKEEVKK